MSPSTSDEATEGYVTSQDGTRIGFLRQGSGPGVVLVQGAGGDAYNYHDLAQTLSSTFTVYTPDRRGRGMSPKPYSAEHTIARDVEDINAILVQTGADRVFGLSSGAMITLEAARTLPQVTKAAVFELPFYPNGISHEGIRRLNAEVEQGDLAAALVSALRLTNMAPAPIQVLPRPIARLLAGGVLRFDNRRSSPYVKLRDLVPGIRHDFNVVGGMDGKMATFASIRKPILLLSGTKSATYLRQSIRELEDILPNAKHIELDGLSHAGPWNAGRGGRPEVVAQALLEFFT